MRRYDYRFLADQVPGKVVGLTAIIEDLRTKQSIRKQQYAQTFEQLRKKAIIASIKESNAIEGIVTTEKRVRDIVAGHKPHTHDEMEIAGYKDALNLIHTTHDALQIDERFLLHLHEMLVAETDPVNAGTFKTEDNKIMEYAPDGSRRVRFTPVRAFETKASVEQWLYAYYDARQKAEIPRLLLIPCAILDFLCIHPFSDGNGRVSRLLTIQMLYDAGYDISAYISLEAQISKYKAAYYDALEQSSAGWHAQENNYNPFMIHFMQILYRCFRDLDAHFMEVSLKKAKKKERVEAVVLNAFAPVSKAEIMDMLPDVSVKTVELALQNLQKDGKIKKIGTYRDARYMKR